MMKGRVFAAQQPMRYDKRVDEMVPSMDLTPATEYGELVIVTSWVGADALLMSVPVVRKIRDALRHYNDDDYLLAVGDPGMIAVMGAVAAAANRGRFKVLKWDGRARRYLEVPYDVSGRAV